MNIGIAITENYIKYAYVMLTSLFENNRETLNVYVLHHGITEEKMSPLRDLAIRYQQSLHFLCITSDMLPQESMTNDKWPIEVYDRIFLPYLLENEERILYLDVDIVVNGDLSKLYDMNFEGNSLIATCDVNNSVLDQTQEILLGDIKASWDEADMGRPYTYFNSGVLLMNASKIRETLTVADFVRTISEKKDLLRAPDQDLLNYLFARDVKIVEREIYNTPARLSYNRGVNYSKYKESESVILHFMGPKPWSKSNLRTDIELVWWDYARQTPYYYELTEEILMSELYANYSSTNEIKYLTYQLEEARAENDRLKGLNANLVQMMEESKELIEKLVGQNR